VPVPVAALKYPITILIVSLSLLASVHSQAQTVSLKLNQSSLENAFNAIQQQTGYFFVFTRQQVKKARPVTAQFSGLPIKEALDICFKNQPLYYAINNKHIVVKYLATDSRQRDSAKAIVITGRVANTEGAALAGVTVQVVGKNVVTATNTNGIFTIHDASLPLLLEFTHVSYETGSISVSGSGFIEISLAPRVNNLDETLVIAYGTTTKRLATGNVGKITAEQIASQPVLNPVAAMQGRIPGLVVTQTSGVSGAALKVEIRGRTSLDASISGNDPLFIVDGVPFAPGNNNFNQLRSAANNPTNSDVGGMSPLAYINPADIESVEVLKDADATAIYGSRGANGVVLITTKKGKSGNLTVTADVYYGQSEVNRSAPMLNTRQYLALRREAFANDTVTPTVNLAPDLLVWDTTRYTDFRKLLIGGTAAMTNARLALSGGTAQTNFLFNGGWRRETSVYPGELSNNIISGQFGINHKTKNEKLHFALQTMYNTGTNNLISRDLSVYLPLPPNLPALKDNEGNLNWANDGFDYTNPLAELLRVYETENDNLSTNLSLNYNFTPSLALKIAGGYNLFQSNEKSLHPLASVNPVSGSLAFAEYGNAKAKSWIMEPQLSYQKKIKHHKIMALLGITWQQQDNHSNRITAQDYTSDLLLGSVAAAPTVYASNTSRRYRYNALFGRLSYNFKDKYLANLSGRRDASSRFGPGNRIGNFGAVGGAWLFSKEQWFSVNAINYGKLRMSYGITGNDQVGDYRYLDNWRNVALVYEGIVGLQPSQLYNPDYSWENNKKWEASLDVGLWKEAVLMSATYFINRSSNRLLNYTLPVQTGFASVLQNWNATVENKGWELSLSAKSSRKPKLGWSLDFNLTIPENKLVSFPGLALSSYRTVFVEGQSLSVIRAYRYLGVNPQTGIYQFRDKDSNNVLNSLDYEVVGKTDPRFYGGLNIGLSYKSLQLAVLVEFRSQLGRNILATQSTDIPGYSMDNQSTFALDRWPLNKANPLYQRATVRAGTDPYRAAVINLPMSEAIFSDASFVRGKNISLAYNFKLARNSKKIGGKFYINGQNIFTITRYKGADPENQSLYMLPPLRTIVAGIQINL